MDNTDEDLGSRGPYQRTSAARATAYNQRQATGHFWTMQTTYSVRQLALELDHAAAFHFLVLTYRTRNQA
jgi:hypothetical protein